MSNIEQVKKQIAEVESEIEDIKLQISSKQKEIDNFEYECEESEYDDFLDEVYGEVNVCGMTYSTSYALKELDPTAYRCGFSDYCSEYDLDAVAEYQDLKQELEDLESELEDLESELEELQDQLDSLESEVIWNKSESRLNGLYWAESNDGEMLSFNSQEELLNFLNDQ